MFCIVSANNPDFFSLKGLTFVYFSTQIFSISSSLFRLHNAASQFYRERYKIENDDIVSIKSWRNVKAWTDINKSSKYRKKM